MKNAIAEGFQQVVGMRLLVAPFFAAGVILMNFMDPLLRAVQENAEMTQGYHIKLLTNGLRSESLSVFLPILAVLPFSGSYIDDMKNKFAVFFLIRSNCRIYLTSRVLVGFLSGGLAIMAGVLIAGGTAALVLIPLEEEIMGVENTPVSSMVEACILLFLNGGLWAVVGMAMSTLMESKYIAYASPFVIYYLLVILYERYFPDCFLICPREWVNPSNLWPLGFWGPAILMTELTILFALIFIFRAGRRLREL